MKNSVYFEVARFVRAAHACSCRLIFRAIGSVWEEEEEFKCMAGHRIKLPARIATLRLSKQLRMIVRMSVGRDPQPHRGANALGLKRIEHLT